MKRLLIPIFFFILSSAYYILQACPTFYFWDSAELTAAVVVGGVPHPPGFPLLLLISAFWAKIVPFELSYSLNLFSAIWGSLGLALWYLATTRIFRGFFPDAEKSLINFYSALSVLVIGISFTYAIQAVRFEVYSLNFAGFGALVLLALETAERGKFTAFLFLAFWSLAGLLLGAHNLTIALALPGVIIIACKGQGLPVKRILGGILFSLLVSGLLFLSIYLRAKGEPALNWGDPSNLSRFFDYILVKGFSVSGSRLGLSHFTEQFKFVFLVLATQIGLPAMLVSVYGAAAMIRKKAAYALPLILIFILNLLSVSFAENYFYENYDLHGYLMISLAIMGIFMAAGFISISQYIGLKLRKSGRSIFPRALPIFIALIFVSIPIIQNFGSADLSKVTAARTFAEEFLSKAPDSAIVITSSYNTYFCAMAENSLFGDSNKRTIVNLYDWDHLWGRQATNRRFGLDIDTGNSRQGYYRDFLSKFLKTRPLYIEYDVSSSPLARMLYPRGLGYLLDVSDTSTVMDPGIKKYVEMSQSANELESVRTWVLWFQNRGEYFEKRGDINLAQACYAAVESLAARVEIK